MTATHLLIADDITGGNDSGIQFAKCGLEARLLLNPERPASHKNGVVERESVLILNTDTRNLSTSETPLRMRRRLNALNGLKAPGPARGVVFKKIDSTLRGNVGLELDIVLDSLGFETAFFAPSYPAQGRSVKDGRLLVHGVPVDKTEFATDPKTPSSIAYIPACLAAQSARKSGVIPLSAVKDGPEALETAVKQLRQQGCSIFIFDAETQADLAAIAQAGMKQEKTPLFVGSAGLAREMAEHIAATASSRAFSHEPLVENNGKTTLFVCGSASRATRDKVEALSRAADMPILRLPESSGPLSTDATNVFAAKVAAAAAAGPSIFASPSASDTSRAMQRSNGITEAMAQVTAAALAAVPARPQDIRLFLTGGETALAVLEMLGVQELRLEAELLPGIVHAEALGGPWDGMAIITKAGGFGDPAALTLLLPLMGIR